MGTSESFGGSGSADWARVREEWACFDPGGSGAGDGPGDPADDADTETTPDGTLAEGSSAYDPLIEAIADALIGEDKDARQPSVPSVPLSAVLPGRGGGRGGGDAGGGGFGADDGSSSNGRRVTSQAARGGSAIGAAAAYRDRDPTALAGYGLTLEDLDALSPRRRCARILDVAIGQSGHPDEHAMREASVAQVKALVCGTPEAATISPLESVRDFIRELTIRLGLIELRDQYQAKAMTAAQSRTREKGLRQWVRAKVARLDLAKYGRVSTAELHQCARQMSADVLRLLRGDS